MPRRACRKDAVHDELKSIAEALGWWVLDTFQVAQYIPGFPDQVWVCPSATVFVEIKSPGGKLTPDEETWLLECVDAGGKYEVVRREADVLDVTRTYWPGRVV